MRYRAAAIILALGAAVAIGQVPMYSDYPWGLVQDGVDRGPVWNLNCKAPLNCTVPSYGNGRIELGDGGTLNINVAYAADAGLSQAALNAFAALWAADAGNVVCSRCILTDRIGLGAVNTDNLDAGAVTAVNILDSAIIESKLAAAAVTSGKIAASAVGSTQIADGAVLEAKVGTGAITNTKLGALSVDSAKLADGSVIEAKVGTGAVTNTKLGALAVDSGKIADGAVVEAKVGTGAITNTKIGALAVDSGKLAAAAVTTAKIATGAVTSNELGAAAVTTAKLAAGAVDNAALGDLSISSGKLQDSAVTTAKLNALAVDSTKLAAAAVTTAKLATGAVTSNELGAAAVTTAKIATGAVTSNELGAAAVTTAKLATGAVTANELGTGAVTTAKILDGNVTTIKVADANITTAKVADSAITSGKVAAQAIDWTKLDDGAPIMAWDEGRGSLLSGRVTLTNGGTLQSPEVNQGYTSWAVTTGATDFYVETDVQFRTVKDQYVSITYRTGGTTGWASSSTMKVVNMGNTAQTATATMYGDGLWHTAVFDISAWTGTSTVRFDAQDGGAAIGAGATFWVANLAVGSVGVGPGGGHTLVSYRGAVGINKAVPGVDLDINGRDSQNVWSRLNGFNGIPLFATQRAAGTASAPTIVTDGTETGRVDFRGYDGATYFQTAAIASYVNGTPGSSDMPGRLAFLTTSDGASAATERMGITRDGVVTINKPTAGGGAALNITGTDTVYQAIATTSSTAASFPQLQLLNYSANGGFPNHQFYNSRGTAASPSGSNSGDVLGANIYYGRVLASFAEGARQEAVLTAAPGTTTLTTALRWYTSNASSSTEKLRLTPAGALAIGATSTSGNTFLLVNSGDLQMGQNTGVLSNTYYDTAWRYAANGFASAITQTSGAVQFQTAPNNISGAGATATMTERMRVANGGNVSIGVAADGEEKLEVRTGSSAYGLLHSNGTIKLGTYISTVEAQFGTKSNHDLGIFTNNAGASLRVTAAGEVRIPAYAGGGTTGASLDNNGRIIRTVSDERLKENISDLPRGLDSVLKMRPVRFQWRDKQAFGDRWDIGFIAQEMISTVPEAVSTTPEGMYSLDYGKLLAVVVGAIQELFDDRTWLAKRVQELEDRAQRAEDKLAQLEARLLSLENYSGIKGCGNCPQTDDGENPP
jgi:hypothetical protein